MRLSLQYLVAAATLVAFCATQLPPPTVTERDAAADIIKNIINTNTEPIGSTSLVRHPFRAGFVRLAFHDCASGSCDGCINHNIDENKGLKKYTDELDAAYGANPIVNEKMSRADFYMLAGVVALDEAAEPGSSSNVHFNGLNLFKFGRTDCSSSPNGAEPTSDFLSAHTGRFDKNNGIHKFFKDKFGTGFTLQDSVAILGAHTLGKCDFDNSKFEGKWQTAVNANGAQSDFLTNRYYKFIAGDWHQVRAEKGGVQGNLQWRRIVGGGLRLMLNVDMAIAFDLTNVNQENLIAQEGEVKTCVIDVNEDQQGNKSPGEQTCESTTLLCCPKSVANQGGPDVDTNYFYRYATDFPRWITEFRVAYWKMIFNDATGMSLPTSPPPP